MAEKMDYLSYAQAQKYMETISKAGVVPGLDSIRNLMRELSDVQEKLTILHLAGTNGKGSVGAFLAAALMEAGYRVGRYTSPAVFSPLEIWQINGVSITEEAYAVCLSQVRAACEHLVSRGLPQPTAFEVDTAVAFLWFYQNKCDYVLLETGMGGREDATNLITHPLCSVITSIGMDHMQYLGETQPEIARQKAGIIKPGCPVVTVEQKPEVMEVIEQTARERGARLWVTETGRCTRLEQRRDRLSYGYREEPSEPPQKVTDAEAEDGVGLPMAGEKTVSFTLPMAGSYQMENSLLALTVLRRVLCIPIATIRRGFAKASWPGRFELIGERPFFVIDGAPNYDAAEKLKESLENCFTNRRITYIIGVLQDKERENMLKLMLPLAARVYTVTPSNVRALAGHLLAGEVREVLHALGRETECAVTDCETVRRAVEQSLLGSGADDVILAWGSLSYLAEVKACVTETMPGKLWAGEVDRYDGHGKNQSGRAPDH